MNTTTVKEVTVVLTNNSFLARKLDNLSNDSRSAHVVLVDCETPSGIVDTVIDNLSTQLQMYDIKIVAILHAMSGLSAEIKDEVELLLSEPDLLWNKNGRIPVCCGYAMVSGISTAITDMLKLANNNNIKARLNQKPSKGIMKFGQAFDLLANGECNIAAINSSWSHKDFLTLTPSVEVLADSFWSPSNKQAAIERGGVLTVLPYIMHTTKQGTRPFTIGNDHLFTEWMDVNDMVIVKAIKENSEGVVKLEFGISTEHELLYQDNPLWLAYGAGCFDVDSLIVIIGGSDVGKPRNMSSNTNKLTKVISLASAAHRYRATTYDTFINDLSENDINPSFSSIDLSSSNSSEDIRSWIDTAYTHGMQSMKKVSFIIDNSDLVGLVVDGEEIVKIVTNYLYSKFSKGLSVSWDVVDLDKVIIKEEF